MKKQKKCIDLVNKKYQSRLKDLREAYNNQNIDLSTWLSEYGFKLGLCCA
jgi:hypothetical protein